MAKRYSKQQMQKLVEGSSPLLDPTLQEIASFTFDDEILIKRIRISVLDAVPNSPQSGVKVYVCQLDDPTTANPATDVLSETRLVTFKFGTSFVNLDQTITMRKLAGSCVKVYADTVAGIHNFKCHSVLHYLEV